MADLAEQGAIECDKPVLHRLHAVTGHGRSCRRLNAAGNSPSSAVIMVRRPGWVPSIRSAVAREDRMPHLRHRWAACEALGVDEAVIWPHAIRTAVKTGPDREIAAVYPYRAACRAYLWRKLITSAACEITLAGYTSYFLWIEQPNLGGALRRKAQTGCKVRFLVGDPGSDVTCQREQIEAT